ncbi:MAG: hypothetical protein K9L31_02815 [Candidatus Pacebacteria bacterium]|nr:hypothetical protein [Candidatus Paceibacterota bacterium]
MIEFCRNYLIYIEEKHVEFYLKERYATKNEFYSLEKLIGYLRSQSQKVKLIIRDKVEFSRTNSKMTYLGVVKFLGRCSYEEALYVHDILEREEDEVVAQLRTLSIELERSSLEKT